MKRCLTVLLALLLLCGCSGQNLFPDEYVYVHEHDAPFAVKETVANTEPTEPEPENTIKTVSRASDIRNAIKEMIRNGESTGQFLLKNYMGDVQDDARGMFDLLLADSPKYNYAMESFDCSVVYNQIGVFVKVNMKLRLKPEDIEDIKDYLFIKSATKDMFKALDDQVSSFTAQISRYEETDFKEMLDDHILHNPDQIVEAPEIFQEVYPHTGNVRVVALRFIYHATRETLRSHRDDVRLFLNLTANQLVNAASTQEIVEILYLNLVSAKYESTENATVYSQTVRKLGSSRTMASVAEHLCNRVNADCGIMIGEREGEPWYWNCIRTEEGWRYFDLHAAALSGEAPVLYTAEEMSGYSWDTERFRDYMDPEPEPPTEPDPPQTPTEPVSTEEPTPTEPVSTEPVPSEPVTTEAAGTEPASEPEVTTEPAVTVMDPETAGTEATDGSDLEAP